MVFGKIYDETLWTMANGINNKEMLKFIQKMPLAFCAQIKEKTEKYLEYKRNNVKFDDRDEKHLKGKFITLDGMTYKFVIHLSGMLVISVQSQDCFIKNETYSLILIPSTNYRKLNDNFEGQYIGTFGYNLHFVDGNNRWGVKKDEISYYVVKTPMGEVLSSKNERGILKNKIRLLRQDQIPEDIKVEDFINRGNKFTRKRSKK